MNIGTSRKQRTTNTLLRVALFGTALFSLCSCTTELGSSERDGSGSGYEQMLSADQSPAKAITTAHTVTFSINKWLDAAGSERAPVGGAFDGVAVQLSQNVSGIANLEQLAGITASVQIDLGSVNTDMVLRDENIEVAYFDFPNFLSATFTVDNLRPQGTGPRGTVLADGILTLHGASVMFSDIELDFVHTGTGWDVATKNSLVIRHADFGMDTAPLLELCGHAGIDAEATVDAHFFL